MEWPGVSVAALRTQNWGESVSSVTGQLGQGWGPEKASPPY